MLYFNTLFFITNIVVKARNGFSVVIFVFMSKVLFFSTLESYFSPRFIRIRKDKKDSNKKNQAQGRREEKCLVRDGGCFFFLAAVALIA